MLSIANTNYKTAVLNAYSEILQRQTLKVKQKTIYFWTQESINATITTKIPIRCSQTWWTFVGGLSSKFLLTEPLVEVVALWQR